MTKSPLAVTLLPLLPLAALAWPLSSIIYQDAYVPPPLEAKTSTSQLITAELYVQSAHPFQEISVKIGEATWTFGPDEYEKEIHFPADKEIFLTVSITWPPDTPETAALIHLTPENRLDRSHTIWGELEVTEEVKFTWEDES